jgi:glycosyltransferase involved in cell wall biosynthesis
MPELVYVANNRLPTEKAHGLQMVQNCEALAGVGYHVTLVAPRRINTPELRRARPLWEHYGVDRCFDLRRLPCLDLYGWFPRSRVTFLSQTYTFLLALLIWLLPRRVAVLYTRDMFVGMALALFRPRTRLVYEVHDLHHSALGRRMQRYLARQAYVVAITQPLADEMRQMGAKHILTAHDGVRAARFADVPDQAEARAQAGWPPQGFLVGWAGRLHVMGVDKGVGLLVEALREVEGASLVIIGGPPETVEELRQSWIAAGMDSARFLSPGQVAPEHVPLYLSACDVCVLPQPWTQRFAYYTSPMKLFEYMAARRAMVVTDLPGFVGVVADGETALLVPAGDAEAMASALRRLRDDLALRQRLADAAHTRVMQHFTWEARALLIRAFVEQ